MTRPRIRARAPLRISFAGGGTDVPSFRRSRRLCPVGDHRPLRLWIPQSRTYRKVTIESVDFKTTHETTLDSEILYDGSLRPDQGGGSAVTVRTATTWCCGPALRPARGWARRRR
jgi:hypothetical protein